MSTKHTSSCLKNATDDEPIFVLRAQDRTAPDTIREWVRLNKHNPEMPREKLATALDLAREMEKWPARRLAD